MRRTKSGILLPDTAKEKPQEGIIEAARHGRYNEQTGVRVPLDREVGDRVMYAKYAGSGGQDRRCGVPDPRREGHPCRRREERQEVNSNGSKAASLRGARTRGARTRCGDRRRHRRGGHSDHGSHGRFDKKFGPPLISQ